MADLRFISSKIHLHPPLLSSIKCVSPASVRLTHPPLRSSFKRQLSKLFVTTKRQHYAFRLTQLKQTSHYWGRALPPNPYTLNSLGTAVAIPKPHANPLSPLSQGEPPPVQGFALGNPPPREGFAPPLGEPPHPPEGKRGDFRPPFVRSADHSVHGLRPYPIRMGFAPLAPPRFARRCEYAMGSFHSPPTRRWARK